MKPTIATFQGEYRFLSNFYPVHIRFEGIDYPSVEHAFQAAKTLDRRQKRTISELSSASDAKKEGRKVTLREDWEEVKIDVMEKLLRLKFEVSELRKALLATNDFELVEGNWWNDTFWGVCRGKGENHLGKLLMKIRSEFRKI